MRKLLMVALLGAAGLATPAPAFGQFYFRPATSPFYRPPVSPYLNLTRPGLTGINYYNLVRPQVDTAAAIQQLQLQQQALLGAGLAGQDATAALTTGHSTRFMNFGQYFLNQGGAGVPVTLRSGAATPQLLGVATTRPGVSPGASVPRAATPGAVTPRR